MPESTPIIMIDNYDSFTYNLVDQFRRLGSEVTVFRNDTPPGKIFTGKLKANKPVVILSPGPGNPANAGFCLDIIKRYAGELPILGICLGHQAIVEAFGGEIGAAKDIVHGQADDIFITQHQVFEDLPNPMQAARYHSLAAVQMPDELAVIAQTQDEVMAIAHNRLPILGFQFHPESILTTQGSQLLKQSLHWLTKD